MTDAVVVAIIAAIAGIVTTVLQLGSRRQMRAVRDQLENDHAKDPHKVTNLRDDLDGKHNELLAPIRAVVRDIGGIREELRQLRRDLSHTNERVDDLERTRPPLTPKEKASWENTQQ
jgi:hypothetical protein